ncbi:ATP-binding protein [Shewanella sp. WXL01]|uniref:ATP-binding protein n=1 Tax=Shewanella sp. WXL01 TaxID=2709721 RepID=UPI00143847CC|nr:ATP-binding protein [Shewanella sp. WXL01]NKF52786.1 ATP-binding protein [Shewanella sp. WXL01]
MTRQAKPRVDTSRKADVRAVYGATGSAKSSYVKKELKRLKCSRVIIWDPVDEYGELPNIIKVTRATELVDLLRRYPKGALKVRFVTSDFSLFELWARCAFSWCNAAVVAEEIADVTTPSKAPPWWGQVIRKGRARGLAPIFGLSQRPAEADKTLLGNATLVRCGRLTRAKDRKMMADEMDIDPKQISKLVPLEYVQKDMNTNVVIKGAIDKRKTEQIPTN